MGNYKINWWVVLFIWYAVFSYATGRSDGRAAQIRESIPTQEEIEIYNKKYVDDVLKTCKELWEK